MPLRVSKSYREVIVHFMRTGKPRFQRLQHGSRLQRKLARELLSKNVHFVQDWDVYECQLPNNAERTRHIVGTVDHHNQILVSNPVLSIFPESREITTDVGEIFRLGGRVQGGVEVDTKWAWWRDRNGATDAVRVTPEIKAMLSIQERPVPLTPQAKDLRTLLTDHGSDAYKKLVRGAKIITPLL